MQHKILRFLKERNEYTSGDQLAGRLGISRQALWKHIQELKSQGYDIEAIPHLGYRLKSSPDRLFPSEITSNLKTKFVGQKVYYFDKVSSTMDLAMQLGIKNAAEGTLILAEQQTKGKGRLGRPWQSPKYKGIYMSLLLRPKILPSLSPVLTLMAAVSVVQAVKETCGLDAQIKWPNDVLVAQKKLAGILTELKGEMDAVCFIIIGIGLNVNNDKKSLPQGATSLRLELKQEIDRVFFLKELLRKLENNYLEFREHGPEQILQSWRNYSLTLGRRVKVIFQKRELIGQAVDIESDGGLIVRRDSGLAEKIMSGDILHCR
jgi:BirA family biotin operon repressor/biotin-[acetyl-CoA-carboxylase] ligase